jgi:hypothetical protein
VVVVPPANLPAFQERIRSRLEQSLDYFYPMKDREQASKSLDRLAVQIAEVPAVYGRFSSVEQLKNDLLNKH